MKWILKICVSFAVKYISASALCFRSLTRAFEEDYSNFAHKLLLSRIVGMQMDK